MAGTRFEQSLKVLTGATGRRDALRSLGAAGMVLLASLGLQDATSRKKDAKGEGQNGDKGRGGRKKQQDRRRQPTGQRQEELDEPAAGTTGPTGSGEPGDGSARQPVQAEKKGKPKPKPKPGPTGPTGPTGPSGGGGSASTVFAADLFRITDNATNPSKRLAFSVDAIGANETRTLAVPDASTTLVGADVAQTLTRKTLQAATPSDSAVVVQGAAGQSAPLIVLQNSGGAELLRLDAESGSGNTWLGQRAGAANAAGAFNTALGDLALLRNTDGSGNTAVGTGALRNNTTGIHNTAVGLDALRDNETGNRNTALGVEALVLNTGHSNTAVGWAALAANIASDNTALGAAALSRTITGFANTALGNEALQNNTSSANTAVGNQALATNTAGPNNTAAGHRSLLNNSTGESNTAVGVTAMLFNTTGDFNTVLGASALLSNKDGDFNTALGYVALLSNTTGFRNTAVGRDALGSNTTGENNTALGYGALLGANFSNATGVGAESEVDGDNQVQLGNSNTSTYAFGAVQDRSDRRDKTDVRDTILGLDFVRALHPVDFRWDLRDDYRPARPSAPGAEASEAERAAYSSKLAHWAEASQLGNLSHDGRHTRTRFHHGLIAQEVAEVIARTGIDFGGYQDHTINGGDDVLSVGYEEFIAPLIKAVQELSARNDDLAAEHARVQERLAALEAARVT